MHPKATHILGNWRIQALAPGLVRVEAKGRAGFEDRTTFTIVERDWPGVPLAADGNTVRVGEAMVTILGDDAFEVRHRGEVVWRFEGEVPTPQPLPAPGTDGLFVVADAPRVVPPAWGATPAPEGNALHPETSGWDLANDAPDLYLFLPGMGHEEARRLFLKLTGPTPMPPLWAFGRWSSWWHAYTEATALAEIAQFKQRDCPLDVLVIDTDWRIGCSHGYAVDEACFPDMRRFIERAHAAGVRLVYNDHPEPIAETALDPKEMAYRFDGLKSLLDMGIDAWWYDRNWHTRLREPLPGLKAEVWGMRVYHDATERVRPGRRPMIMANTQGIDNGYRHYNPHPAAHRFPIWWTGDTACSFDFLRRGVANAVNWGVEFAHPYLSEDLGGHAQMPTAELYIRFLQFGALSAIMRPHGTKDRSRKPWDYGELAEGITRDFTKLRYRLMPMLYSLARESYESGMPMLRRMDLAFPGMPALDDQFMLGEDLLVAPIMESGYRFENANPGRGEGQERLLITASNESFRVWDGDELVIDRWIPAAEQAQMGVLGAGSGRALRIETQDPEAEVELRTMPLGPQPPPVRRTVHLPPGEWVSWFTGEVLEGTVSVECPIEHMPIFVRRGGLLLTTSATCTLTEARWSEVIIDAFPSPGMTTKRVLYEDDGESTAYLAGSFTKTEVAVSWEDAIEVTAPQDRVWRLRLRLPRGFTLASSSLVLQGEPGGQGEVWEGTLTAGVTRLAVEAA